MIRLFDRRNIVRAAGAVILVYVLWLAISVSFANGVRRSSPDLALKLRGNDALAQTIKADLSLSAEAGPAVLRDAERLVKAAIERDPTDARSFRVLAMIDTLQGDEGAAARRFTYADALSRRDLPTQLWLIENYVARNDVDNALHRFAIALTTSPGSKEVLFPVLVNAVSDPALIAPITEFLSVDRFWRHELLFRVASDAPSIGTLDRLFSSLRAQRQPIEDDVTQALLDRFVTAGAFETAARHYSLAAGSAASGAALRDGDFRSQPRFPPIDWELTEAGDANAAIVSDEANARSGALEFSSSSEVEATVARQLLTLGPGRYSIRSEGLLTEAGDTGVARWSLRCAGDDRELVGLPSFERSEQPQPRTGAFSVPASGCAGQWLSLLVDVGRRGGNIFGAVETIGIERAPLN